MDSTALLRRFVPAVVALLLLWGTRLAALELLPLHNDEGLHLTRAVEVWNGHPFWVISDGKIINHWLIAVFYPQHAPVFAGRVATVFVALIGMAAGMRLARQVGGSPGMALAAALWIGSPYLFFYERLAFSDAEAGALAVVAVWAALRFSAGRGGRWWAAALAGAALGLAALFKFTAVPTALSVGLMLLLAGTMPLRLRVRGLLTVAAVVAACFALPLAYLALRGDDFFSIALGWIGGSGGARPAVLENLARFADQLTGFGTVTWAVLAGAGLLLLLIYPRGTNARSARLLALAGLLPLLLMMVLGREVLSRHFVAPLPLLLALAGGGLGAALRRVGDRRSRAMAAALGTVGLLLGLAPFALTAYSNPAVLPLPADARYEHITSHSAGYGLEAGMRALPQTVTRPDLAIIGSMFPDSCRRANFYAAPGFTLICSDAPGREAVEAALAENGAVYVLADSAPLIGLDVATVDARATRLAAYPRPGESEANAAVVLWLLER